MPLARKTDSSPSSSATVAAGPGQRQASGFAPRHSAPAGTGIDGTDFLTPDQARLSRAQSVGMIFGRTGVGKTWFVTHYVSPSLPLYLISLDGRAKDAVDDAIEAGRVVYPAYCDMPADVLSLSHEEAQSYGQECLSKVMRNLRYASDQARKAGGKVVICIDTAVELVDGVRLAVRGRVDRPANTKDDKGDFGKSDAIIKRQLASIVQIGRQSGAHFILTTQAKPIYDGREATGRYTYDTDQRLAEGVDWIVELRRSGGDVGVRTLGSAAVAAKPSWSLSVAKAGTDRTGEELGQVYTEKDWQEYETGPWQYMSARLYPTTSTEDWE